MNDKEINIKKLILKFSIQFYEIKEKKLNMFNNYCNYGINLTNYYINNKFNNSNKKNNVIINNNNIFSQSGQINPSDLLNCGLDFEDETLVEYFNNLIIY